MPSTLSSLRFSLAAVAVLAVGCASWKDPLPPGTAVETTGTDRLHESKKRIILEVEFVNIATDAGDIDQSESLWQWVDETAVDAAIRRRLQANGLRAGFVANDERLRQRLADLVTDQDVVESFLSQASVASEVSHGKQRIPMRLGRRYELPLRQPIAGSHVVLLRIGDETIGRTLNHAQYFFAITATQGDAQQQVHLRIRPEIQFGDTRQKWVSSDSALRIDNRRETWSMEELDLEVNAGERDTLVITAATPVHGLAKHMLIGSNASHQQQQVVVLIRVAQIPSAVDQI